MGLPRSEAEPASAHAGELIGSGPMVGSEDEAEARADDIERAALVRKILNVAEVELDVRRLAAGAFQHARRDVDARHERASRVGSNRNTSRAGGDVEPALTVSRLKTRDELVVDRREPLRHLLVIRQAPELGGALRAAQSCSFARAVSSLRASQSSGYISCLISLPSSST